MRILFEKSLSRRHKGTKGTEGRKARGFFFLLIAHCSLLIAPCLFAQNDEEAHRLNTIKYGTETEIAALIQLLKADNTDYLDNEIITLVEKTYNPRILAGAFPFFGDREKSGLEARAIRAITEQENERNETILAALDYLGKVKATSASAALQKVIESGEKRFMNAAFRAYGRVNESNSGSAEAADYLVDYYENRGPEDDYRREILVATGVTGSVKAVEFLAGLATNTDERASLRIAALEAIAKIGDANAGMQAGLDSVLECISDSDATVRAAAVAALGPFSGKAVDDAILEAFRDSNYRSRAAAAQASRQRKLAAAVPYLKFRAERDEVPAVRDDSIRALGEIADDEATKILETLFTERKNSDRTRLLSGEMLMKLDAGRFLDPFVKELDDAKQKNQSALYNGLLKILGGITTSGVESIARRLMQDKGVVERSYALDLAVNNNLTGLASEIKTVTEDKNASLAAKAKRTLEKLGIQ